MDPQPPTKVVTVTLTFKDSGRMCRVVIDQEADTEDFLSLAAFVAGELPQRMAEHRAKQSPLVVARSLPSAMQ